MSGGTAGLGCDRASQFAPREALPECGPSGAPDGPCQPPVGGEGGIPGYDSALPDIWAHRYGHHRGPWQERHSAKWILVIGREGAVAVHHEPGMIGDMARGSLTGQLLVATPTLRDPNFERTVVLLVAHEPGGALGVVLNRATEVPVSEVLGGWGLLAGSPPVVFEGGPVQPEAAICLARLRPGSEPRGFSQVSGPIGTVDLSRDPESLRGSVEGVRVFAGYAGWDGGQLESELNDGSWFVFDALPGDPLFPQPDDLWALVLRRQGGLTAAVAHFPSDPMLN